MDEMAGAAATNFVAKVTKTQDPWKANLENEGIEMILGLGRHQSVQLLSQRSGSL